MLIDTFYKNNDELLKGFESNFTRHLAKEIDWSHRLIGIKGTRGIGKTFFLLDYIKNNYSNSKECLYVNMNNFYFSTNSLVDFADTFRKKGGKILVLDQVFKYPEWSESLAEIYDKFIDLHVVFAGSTVMQLDENNKNLYGKVKEYSLNGLSFCEYLSNKTEEKFESYSLKTLINNHIEIAKEITSKVKPLAFFDEYLKHGFYPFESQKTTGFNEMIFKVANLTLEVDIPFLLQIDAQYLPRLKKLFYLLSEDMPHSPNVSKLSKQINTSRPTVNNYLQCLENAQLINLLYSNDLSNNKKPSKVYFQNPNLLYAVAMGNTSIQSLHETFFFNQMKNVGAITSDGKDAEFEVNNELTFKIGKNKYLSKTNPNVFVVSETDEVGSDNKIPLWLFGFVK